MSDDFSITSIMDDDDDNDDLVIVTSPSGATVKVMNQDEADHYERISSRYQEDNKFVNVSDFLELDRILTFEIASYRWSQWFTSGTDYGGRKINQSEAQKALDIFSREIRGIKKDLGIDKSTRDKDQGESLAAYIQTLGVRAKEFGVSRNKQAVRAITILMELRGMITLYENSNDAERKEFSINIEDIIKWIHDQSDEFDEIDAALRKSQTYWIRDI
jgi:hypothetical protein